jgi:hypothetical protein
VPAQSRKIRREDEAGNGAGKCGEITANPARRGLSQIFISIPSFSIRFTSKINRK